MFNKLMVKLFTALANWCQKTNRVFYITGGVNNSVYLVRYIVFKSKWFCLYIHRFMRSDADDPHDHPWNFFTYVLSGGYTERLYDKEQSQLSTEKSDFSAFWTPKINKRPPGSLAYRPATAIHQVVTDRTYEMSELDKAPFTVCLMTKRRRNWGFWPLKDQGAVFVDWRKYLNIEPTDPRITGSE